MTKKDSVSLQGVAIWMMVYHHIFLGVTVYVTAFSFMTPEVVRRIGWFCKICVGIFAFISGYGMYHGMERLPGERFFDRLGAGYRYVLPHIFKLYGRLWLVLAIYLVYYVGIIGWTITAEDILGNVTALNPTCNGVWWYVEQYAKMLLLLPLGDLLLTPFAGKERKKKGIFYAAGAVLILVLAVALRRFGGLGAVVEWFRPAFLAVFAVGYLTARWHVYERVDAFWNKRRGDFRESVPVLPCVALIGVVVVVRVTLAQDAAYAAADFLLTPLLIYGLRGILSRAKPLGRFFAWWGRYSTYIWLVHGFFHIPAIYLTKSFIRYDLPIYFGTLALSAVTAVLLTGIERLPARLLKGKARG